MARFCSEDGAVSMAVGPIFTGDSPSSGRSCPLVASLLLLPVHAAARTDNVQLLTLITYITLRSWLSGVMDSSSILQQTAALGHTQQYGHSAGGVRRRQASLSKGPPQSALRAGVMTAQVGSHLMNRAHLRGQRGLTVAGIRCRVAPVLTAGAIIREAQAGARLEGRCAQG